MSNRTSLCAFLAAASSLAAQGVPTRAVADQLMAPIHTQDPDPTGGSYGIWAAGPSYKTSFHDGWAFYPVLGKGRPKNLPLRWRTESVTADGNPLLVPGHTPTVSHEAWRLTLDHGAVAETYEVRKDGVEQSFVIARRPATPGAIVVRGRIETELVAANATGHVALEFKDAGETLVRYGEAFAVDAAGNKADVVTAWDGEHVTLTVPAEFVAGAAFPLTLDPIASSNQVNTGYRLPVDSLAVGTCPNTPVMNTLVAVSRVSAANDTDLFLIAGNENFYSASVVVYSDLETSWASTNPAVAACAGASRWVVTFQRDFASPAQSAIRAYVHDVNNTVLNSGSLLSVTLNLSNTHRMAQVGGTSGSGKKALIVWQTDTTTTQANTASTEVYGRILDASTKSFPASSFVIHPSAAASLDHERPCVSRMASDNDSWVVAWQQYDNSIVGDDWDIQAARIAQDGTVTGNSPELNVGKVAGHSIHPKIAGQGGRYLVAWNDATNANAPSGLHVYARRFDWSEQSTSPTWQPIRTVETVLQGFGTLALDGVAYDTTSRSHWAVQYRHEQQGVVGSVRLHRVGGTGGNVEKVVVYSNDGTPLSSDVSFYSGANGRYFQSCFHRYETNHTVLLAAVVYNFTQVLSYGSGCGGTIAPGIDPDAGNELYTTGITGIKASTPAALFVSPKMAATPLAPLGMPNCYLNVDTTILVPLNTMSTPAGTATMVLPLPDYPVVTGDLFTQWVWLVPGANSIGALTSQGVAHKVR